MKRLLYVCALSAMMMLILAPAAMAQSRGPSGADGTFNCEDFDSQADAQANLRANPDDPNGLDGPIGEASTGVPGVACETEPYPAGAPRDEVAVTAAPMQQPAGEVKTEAKTEAKAEEKKAKTEAKKEEKKKEEKKKDLPKTGGPATASLLALGAGVLLVGGGLLIRRVK